MSTDYSTSSESLHLNIEQRLDFCIEQETFSGDYTRIEFSAWKRLSVSVCSVNVGRRNCSTSLLPPAK